MVEGRLGSRGRSTDSQELSKYCCLLIGWRRALKILDLLRPLNELTESAFELLEAEFGWLWDAFCVLLLRKTTGSEEAGRGEGLVAYRAVSGLEAGLRDVEVFTRGPLLKSLVLLSHDKAGLIGKHAGWLGLLASTATDEVGEVNVLGLGVRTVSGNVSEETLLVLEVAGKNGQLSFHVRVARCVYSLRSIAALAWCVSQKGELGRRRITFAVDATLFDQDRLCFDQPQLFRGFWGHHLPIFLEPWRERRVTVSRALLVSKLGKVNGTLSGHMMGREENFIVLHLARLLLMVRTWCHHLIYFLCFCQYNWTFLINNYDTNWSYLRPFSILSGKITNFDQN